MAATSLDNLTSLFGLACSLVKKEGIKNDHQLYKLFMNKINELSRCDQSQSLSSDDVTFYNLAKQLLDENQKVRSVTAKKLLNMSAAPPAQSASTVQTVEAVDYSSLIKDKKASLDPLSQVPIEKLIEAIFKETKKAVSYVNLALKMSHQEMKQVALSDGFEVTEQFLYLKAISLDPNCSLAYTRLEATLGPGEFIQLFDPNILTKEQVNIQALDVNNSNKAQACCDLADRLPSKGRFLSRNGRTISKTDLYLKALYFDNSLVSAYYNLLLEINLESLDFTITISGFPMTREDLCVQIIKLDPDGMKGKVYFELGNSMREGHLVTLSTGSTMTRKQAYLKALEYNPNHEGAIRSLKSTLSAGEKVALNNGTVITKA